MLEIVNKKNLNRNRLVGVSGTSYSILHYCADSEGNIRIFKTWRIVDKLKRKDVKC